MPETNQPYPSILAFLSRRFPRIDREIWRERILQGKVLDDQGNLITLETAYLPHKRVFYFREVETEPVIPFSEGLIFQNDHLLVSCKPHFLPVTPGGAYVAECLLNRLGRRTGNNELVPIHRIDRETAGIVMFSTNPETRGLYNQLFADGRVKKRYQAIAEYPGSGKEDRWIVKNRIEVGQPWFRMATSQGEPNACSIIKLIETRGQIARFMLSPLTGKTHQLRLHMSGLGFRILNDRLYPELQAKRDDDFNKPLQLLAKTISFIDPVTGKAMEFRSQRELQW